ncbi:MAG: class I SAM-dependent methyltransferase family protein, partial [Candidatus Odinarchaeota archaeon]
MTRIFNMLKTRLAGRLPSNIIEQLPRGYQKIGDIMIISIKPEVLPYREIIASELTRIIPNTRTVLLKKGGVTGDFREPNLELIIGDSNTETIHVENNCFFKLDVKNIMFSKGNISERRRIAKLVRDGETVVDMFAGIGYFSINIAKHAKPRKIIAIELNPLAYKYLLDNIVLNKVENIIEPIQGDAGEVCDSLPFTADRVIMGLLPSPKKYAKTAVKILRRPGIVHYEGVCQSNSQGEELLDEFIISSGVSKESVKLIGCKNIKSFGPHKNHV